MEKIKGIIDEKNVSSHFIYEMFDVGDFIERYVDGNYHVIGFFDGRLIEVLWRDDDNWAKFSYIPLHGNVATIDDKLKLEDYLNDVDGSNGLCVDVHDDEEGWIVCEFFFSVD